MSSYPKEQLPSLEELKATLFEIPKSLQRLLEKPIANTWGPLTSSEDPAVELSSELIAKSVADSLHKQRQQNKLSSLEVSMEPSNVSELSLDAQNISSLGRAPFPLAPLTKLRQLVLSNNRLMYEGGGAAMNNTKAGSVMSANKNNAAASSISTTSDIQRACLAILPELRELQLDHNLFTVFPMITHAKLEMLNLANNDIHHFEAVSLPKLEFLDLSGNRHLNLLSLGKSKWTSLITLDISRCEIDNLQPLAPLTNLRSLDCHSNNLTSLSGIEPLIHLEFLDASHNAIRQSRLQKAVSVTSTGNPLACCAATLQELHLQHNQISGVNFFPPTGMKSLWKLVLSDNPLGGTAVLMNVIGGDDKNSQTTMMNDEKENGDDDIGDAEYDEDDKKSTASTAAKSITVSGVTKGKPSTAGLARKNSLSSATTVPHNNNNNRKLNSSSATARSSSTTVLGKQNQSTNQQQLSSTGIASKLANLFPQLESLDLARTGVVSSRAELISVCTELSRGCIYLRELDLPLPSIDTEAPTDSASGTNNDDGEQPPSPSKRQIQAGSPEEMELIDLVMEKMSLLARFNGYVIRDEHKLNTAFEDQKTAESQAELRQALEELASLEHLMDTQTMAMLKDFTIETTAKKNDAQREKLLEEFGMLKPRAESARSLLQEMNNNNQNNRNFDRPASAGTQQQQQRPNSAKSSIPKPRPVIHTTGISRSIDQRMQRERDVAKQEFESVIGDISESRVKIEQTLDHVSSSLEYLGVAPQRRGSPFKEVERQAAAAKKLAEKQKQEQEQKRRFVEAAEKYAERAPAVQNIPRPPPKSSKASAESAKLLERVERESEKLKQGLQSAEHHLRTTLHPSSVPSSSQQLMFGSVSRASNNQSVISTPSNSTMMKMNGGNGTKSPLLSSSKRRYTDDSSSGSDNDDEDDKKSGNALIKKMLSASSSPTSNQKQKNGSAALVDEFPTTTKLFTTKGEPLARVSKWSTERKEPLSVRLARITEEFSAREKTIQNTTATTTTNTSSSPSQQKQSQQQGKMRIPSPPPPPPTQKQQQPSSPSKVQFQHHHQSAPSPFIALSEAVQDRNMMTQQQQQDQKMNNSDVGLNAQQSTTSTDQSKPAPKLATFKSASLNTRRR